MLIKLIFTWKMIINIMTKHNQIPVLKLDVECSIFNVHCIYMMNSRIVCRGANNCKLFFCNKFSIKNPRFVIRLKIQWRLTIHNLQHFRYSIHLTSYNKVAIIFETYQENHLWAIFFSFFVVVVRRSSCVFWFFII